MKRLDGKWIINHGVLNRLDGKWIINHDVLNRKIWDQCLGDCDNLYDYRIYNTVNKRIWNPVDRQIYSEALRYRIYQHVASLL